MTQKLPRNQTLHERRHHRKAGPHCEPGRRVMSLTEILDSLVDEYGYDATCVVVEYELSKLNPKGEEN